MHALVKVEKCFSGCEKEFEANNAVHVQIKYSNSAVNLSAAFIIRLAAIKTPLEKFN